MIYKHKIAKHDADDEAVLKFDIDTGRTSSSTKKTKQKPEKENEPTKRESASKRNTRNTKMENPMFDAAGSSESDEEESPTGSFASAKAARKKQMQT